MNVRHRRRSVHAEAVAPWAALSVILLLWWAGARAVDWARLRADITPSAEAPQADRTVAPVDTAGEPPAVVPKPTGAIIAPDTRIRASDVDELRRRSLLVPVRGFDRDDLVSSFHDARGSRKHEAIDILAPKGTDVLAVEDGKVARLFTSAAGGLTVYQFDSTETFVYYYAHLDRYAPGLAEGMWVKRGDLIGRVGTTGNAPKDTPHLHFAISKLDPDRRWWGGTALDPYLVLKD